MHYDMNNPPQAFSYAVWYGNWDIILDDPVPIWRQRISLKQKIVNLTTLLPLVAPWVFIKTAYSDDRVVKLTIFRFQWLQSICWSRKSDWLISNAQAFIYVLVTSRRQAACIHYVDLGQLAPSLCISRDFNIMTTTGSRLHDVTLRGCGHTEIPYKPGVSTVTLRQDRGLRALVEEPGNSFL